MLTLLTFRTLAADCLHPVRSLTVRYWAAQKAAIQRRRTFLALSALDDRTLHDIGLNRSMVMSAATGTAARETGHRNRSETDRELVNSRLASPSALGGRA